MDTVDHDDLAAAAAGEESQRAPREVAGMSKRELRARFAQLLRDYAGELAEIRDTVRRGATMGAAGSIAHLQSKMLDEARSVQS